MGVGGHWISQNYWSFDTPQLYTGGENVFLIQYFFFTHLYYSGGKGTGPADASKVKAFGPGLEKGKVQPGVPTNFTVDSSKTGPATIDVDILGKSL